VVARIFIVVETSRSAEALDNPKLEHPNRPMTRQRKDFFIVSPFLRDGSEGEIAFGSGFKSSRCAARPFPEGNSSGLF
jgi:hypothetical protein